jgi:hypothetical protein
VVVRVKDHKDPDMKEFEKRHAELERDAARAKWYTTVEAWAQERCVELRDAGRIKVSDEILSYDGNATPMRTLKIGKDGKELPGAGYVPCSPRATPQF